MKFYSVLKNQIVLFLLLSFANIAFSQKNDSINFRFQPNKGDAYSLLFSSDVQSTSEIKGKLMNFSQKTNCQFSASANSLLPNGLTRISYKLESFSVIINLKDMELRIDTRGLSKCYGTTQKAKEIADSEYVNAIKDIGLTFWTDVDERGEILRTNIDTIFIMKNDADGMIGGASKQIIHTVSFAGYPVKVGESWKGIGYYNKEGKAISGKANFTLMSLNKKTAEINSDFHGWGDTYDANIIGNFTAVYTVDRVTGLALKTYYKAELEAKKEIAPFKSISTMTVKLTKR